MIRGQTWNLDLRPAHDRALSASSRSGNTRPCRCALTFGAVAARRRRGATNFEHGTSRWPTELLTLLAAPLVKPQLQQATIASSTTALVLLVSQTRSPYQHDQR